MTDDRKTELLKNAVDWMNKVLLSVDKRMSILHDVIGMTDEELVDFGIITREPFADESEAFTMNAILTRKPESFEAEPCKVVKVINVPIETFEDLKENPLQDRDFIKENRDLMRPDAFTGTIRCIFVTSDQTNDAILIDSEGYDYARYASYVPGGRLALNQYLDHCTDEQYEYLMGCDGEGQVMT